MNTVSTGTYQRRLADLVKSVSTHTFRDELLQLMQEQLDDDVLGIYTSSNDTHEDRYH
jgi:hypothetical protein